MARTLEAHAPHREDQHRRRSRFRNKSKSRFDLIVIFSPYEINVGVSIDFQRNTYFIVTACIYQHGESRPDRVKFVRPSDTIYFALLLENITSYLHPGTFALAAVYSCPRNIEFFVFRLGPDDFSAASFPRTGYIVGKKKNKTISNDNNDCDISFRRKRLEK